MTLAIVLLVDTADVGAPALSYKRRLSLLAEPMSGAAPV